MPSVALAHRATLRIGGDEAEPFLQRLVTADLAKLGPGVAHPCALLSPQGKVLHEFGIARDDDGLLIDVSRAFLPDLARRLMLYRLHAAVTFEPRPSATVRAVWNRPAPYRDARFPGGVGRAYGPGEDARADRGEDGGDDTGEDAGALDDWSRLRIAAGVAEIGTDYGADDLFPHDVGLPANGGVAVAKGCYVGQEVVSRMHHRGTGRRRVALVEGDALPAPGTALEAGGRPVGTMGSSIGGLGLAVVRIDRLADALAAGAPVVAGGPPLTITPPPGAEWTTDRAETSGAGASEPA